MEVPLPGWTDAVGSALTELYEQDTADIEALPGIDLILP